MKLNIEVPGTESDINNAHKRSIFSITSINKLKKIKEGIEREKKITKVRARFRQLGAAIAFIDIRIEHLEKLKELRSEFLHKLDSAVEVSRLTDLKKELYKMKEDGVIDDVFFGSLLNHLKNKCKNNIKQLIKEYTIKRSIKRDINELKTYINSLQSVDLIDETEKDSFLTQLE